MSARAAAVAAVRRSAPLSRRAELRYPVGLLAVAAVAALVAYATRGSAYDQFIAETIAIYALAASGLNVAIGFTGQFQMAQAGFMAVAAYTSAILSVDHGWSVWAAAGAGMGLTAVFGLVVSIATARTRSHYLLLATFGLQVLVVDVIRNLSQTGGVNGHQAVTTLPFLGLQLTGSTTTYTVFTIVVAGLGFLAADWLRRSYLGLGMQAARQSERATEAAGLAPGAHKLLGILVSAVYGGVAGILVGPTLTYLVPESFGLSATLVLLVIVVLGGIGSPLGVVAAAVVLTLASQIAQGRTTAWPLVYGLFVMVLLIVAPSGLAGLAGRTRAALRHAPRRRRLAAAEPAPALPGLTVVTNGAAPITALPRVRHREAHETGLRTTEITRRFGGVVALASVSLSVGAGEVHGLVGPNGSGKTTLFNVISGFIRQNSGRVVILDHDVSGRSPRARARSGLARTFQHPNLLDDNSVFENVALGALAATSPLSRLRAVALPRGDRDWRESVLEALDLVGLAAIAEQPVAGLPYGHRRLVDIARALAARPQLVLLDEPTSGVGTTSVTVVKHVIEWLRSRGTTVVLVEHNMRFVADLCDIVTVLNTGRVIARGTPDEVTSDPAVIEAYLGAADASG